MRSGVCGFSHKFLPLAIATETVYNGCMSEKPSPTSITIRIPPEIAETLRTLAKQHDRSLNGEIVRALREHVEHGEHGEHQQEKQ